MFLLLSIVFYNVYQHDKTPTLSGLTFKSRHCCYPTAWMSMDMSMSIWGLYEWVFLHQYLNQPWSEPASLKAHGAPWISSRCTSVTLIFIWVHIIYVGTLWSASELSIHKAMQERGLEESDNAVSTNTAQMIGEDKSFGGGKKKKSWNFISVMTLKLTGLVLSLLTILHSFFVRSNLLS